MPYIITTEEGHRVGSTLFKTRAAARAYITKLNGGSDDSGYFAIEQVDDKRFGLFGA